jgi:hypothetical protein
MNDIIGMFVYARLLADLGSAQGTSGLLAGC